MQIFLLFSGKKYKKRDEYMFFDRYDRKKCANILVINHWLLIFASIAFILSWSLERNCWCFSPSGLKGRCASER